MFSGVRCALRLQRTIGHEARKIRQGKQIVVGYRRATFACCQSARSNGRATEPARELTTSEATELSSAASASRGASAYRITPRWPITNVGWKFLTSASQTM